VTHLLRPQALDAVGALAEGDRARLDLLLEMPELPDEVVDDRGSLKRGVSQGARIVATTARRGAAFRNDGRTGQTTHPLILQPAEALGLVLLLAELLELRVDPAPLVEVGRRRLDRLLLRDLGLLVLGLELERAAPISLRSNGRQTDPLICSMSLASSLGDCCATASTSPWKTRKLRALTRMLCAWSDSWYLSTLTARPLTRYSLEPAAWTTR